MLKSRAKMSKVACLGLEAAALNSTKLAEVGGGSPGPEARALICSRADQCPGLRTRAMEGTASALKLQGVNRWTLIFYDFFE